MGDYAEPNDKFFLKFVATILLIIAVFCGHLTLRVVRRNEALQSFCKTQYGSNYEVDTWSHANNGAYQISCKMSTNAVIANLVY